MLSEEARNCIRRGGERVYNLLKQMTEGTKVLYRAGEIPVGYGMGLVEIREYPGEGTHILRNSEMFNAEQTLEELTKMGVFKHARDFGMNGSTIKYWALPEELSTQPRQCSFHGTYVAFKPNYSARQGLKTLLNEM